MPQVRRVEIVCPNIQECQKLPEIIHVYLNSVQQMVSGELAGECLQTGFERHGLPPQRAPLDTAYPLREHLNSVQRMVSGGYCEGLFPDTVCRTRLRNTWYKCIDLCRDGMVCINAHSSTPTPVFLSSREFFSDHGPRKTRTKTQTTPDSVFTRERRNSDHGPNFWGRN